MTTANPYQLKPWLIAARPKTLTAGFIPVVVAAALALSDKGSISWGLAICAMLTAFFIQIGTNLSNDAEDFKRGADTAERLGPLRVTQAGLLTMQQVIAGSFVCFAAAALFGLPLVYQGGWPLAVALLLSIVFSYLYTSGPAPLAYYGLGDIFVMIFYGLVVMISVYYVLTDAVNSGIILAGIQVGMLATAIIAMNNFRDIKQDEAANKMTLAVRFGENFARMEVTLLIITPFLLGVFWALERHWLAAILPLAALPAGTFVIKGIWTHDPGKIYNKFFGFSALTHLLFGMLLTVSFLIR